MGSARVERGEGDRGRRTGHSGDSRGRFFRFAWPWDMLTRKRSGERSPSRSTHRGQSFFAVGPVRASRPFGGRANGVTTCKPLPPVVLQNETRPSCCQTDPLSSSAASITALESTYGGRDRGRTPVAREGPALPVDYSTGEARRLRSAPRRQVPRCDRSGHMACGRRPTETCSSRFEPPFMAWR